MKFKIGDIIKSNRKGTIGEDTTRKVVGEITYNKKDRYYILENLSFFVAKPLELRVSFVDKGYSKIG